MGQKGEEDKIKLIPKKFVLNYLNKPSGTIYLDKEDCKRIM